MQITEIIARGEPSVINSVIARGEAEFNNFWNEILSCLIIVLLPHYRPCSMKKIESEKRAQSGIINQTIPTV